MSSIEPFYSSGQVTVATTVVICATPARLGGFILNPGSAASTLKIYDHASAETNLIANLVAPANGASVPVPLSIPIYIKNGIVINVAGTAATAEIFFAPA